MGGVVLPAGLGAATPMLVPGSNETATPAAPGPGDHRPRLKRWRGPRPTGSSVLVEATGPLSPSMKFLVLFGERTGSPSMGRPTASLQLWLAISTRSVSI